jgi:hypothetical protein
MRAVAGGLRGDGHAPDLVAAGGESGESGESGDQRC